MKTRPFECKFVAMGCDRYNGQAVDGARYFGSQVITMDYRRNPQLKRHRTMLDDLRYRNATNT